MKHWLGVVSQQHVRRGLELGIAQIGHGKRAGLARMQPDDWLIYYSPRATLTSTRPLQAFTAIGQIADDVIWQADDGDFKPWRRRVAYCADAVDAPLTALAEVLDLTSTPSWGHRLRRGLIELTEHDFQAIQTAMRPS